MIRVRLDRDRGGNPRVLSVRGHADSGPWGQDIVCAAVSALVETLQLGLRQVCREGTAAVGRGEAQFHFPLSLHSETRAVIETFVQGFQDLARSHAKFVEFVEDGKEEVLDATTAVCAQKGWR